MKRVKKLQEAFPFLSEQDALLLLCQDYCAIRHRVTDNEIEIQKRLDSDVDKTVKNYSADMIRADLAVLTSALPEWPQLEEWLPKARAEAAEAMAQSHYA